MAKDLDIPKSSMVDKAVDALVVLATSATESDPWAPIVGVTGSMLPRVYERRSRRFFEQVVEHVVELEIDVEQLSDEVAAAALTQGTIFATTSMSDEHLAYLARATAEAMCVGQEAADHALTLLRIVGAMTATHVRVLAMFADPAKYAERRSLAFAWKADTYGRYDLGQVFTELAGDLTTEFAQMVYRDLGAMGLLGSLDPNDSDNVDGGSVQIPEPDPVNALGRQVLAFVEGP